MSSLKLYADVISPVCRPILLLLRKNEIPFEMVEISLKERQTLSNPELAKINPNKTVPALDDDGFTMFESGAILRYLCAKYQLPDHWYPKGLQARAKVDEALCWFPTNLRCGAFFHAVILPKRTGQPTPEAILKQTQTTLKKNVGILEGYFVKDSKFVAGGEISIADLVFLGEVSQYWLMGLDLCQGNPNMTRWIEDCKTALGDAMDDVYQKFYQIRDSKHLLGKLEFY